MNIQFATCDVNRAKGFIEDVVGKEINWEQHEPFLELIRKDAIRVQDPMMYGKRIAIIPATNWKEEYRDIVMHHGSQFNELID